MRCIHIESGEQCPKDAVKGSNFCSVHQPLLDERYYGRDVGGERLPGAPAGRPPKPPEAPWKIREEESK